MTFTISNIASSLAGYFAPYFEGVKFYEDPNQQGTDCPCMFLQARGPTKIEKHLDGKYLRTIRLDLTYLEDYNLPDLQRRYQSAAETLDEIFELFPYSDGESSTLIRTYNREWNIDLDALHYRFDLQVFVYPQDNGVPMRTLESDIDVVEPTDDSWNYDLGVWEMGDEPFRS